MDSITESKYLGTNKGEERTFHYQQTPQEEEVRGKKIYEFLSEQDYRKPLVEQPMVCCVKKRKINTERLANKIIKKALKF